jgi:hypothetical protein
MKKLVIIPMLFCSFVFGQQTIEIKKRNLVYIGESLQTITISFENVYLPIPTKNLSFYWDSSHAVRSSDSALMNVATGYYDVNTKLLGSVSSNGTISAKSINKLVFYGDTIPITCLFSNYNYADTLYFRMADHTLNADSTENLPYRLTQIAYYSSEQIGNDSTTLMAYFDIPTVASSGVIWIPDDQSTIAAAITAANANDTIYVQGGDLSLGETSVTVSKDVIIKAVGNVNFTNYPSSFVFNLNSANCKIEGFYMNPEVSQTINIGNSGGGSVIEKCFIEGSTATGLQNNRSVTLNKCVFTNQSYGVYPKQDVTLNQCAFVDLTLGVRKVSADYDLIINYSLFDDMTTAIQSTVAYDSIISIGNVYSNLANVFGVNEVDTLLARYDSYNTTGRVYNADIASPSHGYLEFKNCEGVSSSAGNVLEVFNKDLHIVNSSFTQNSSGKIVNVTTDDNFDIEMIVDSSEFHTTDDGEGAFSIGDADFVIEDRIYGRINKCKIFGGQYYGASSPASHGIALWANDSVDFTFNFIDGWLLPFVMKGDGTNYNNVEIMGNVWLNGRCVLKGIDSVKVYNNTGVITDDVNTEIISSTEEETGNPSRGNEIYNNIFANLNSDRTETIALFAIENENETFESDYNIWYNPNGIIADSVGTDKSFAQWQTDGLDANSYNTNPNFATGTYYSETPTDADGNGVDLGTDYDDILLNTSTWPDGVNTATQDASWDIGAYKIE